MNVALYGMDVGFYSHVGAYPLETRCEMLAELGFAATNLTLWSEAAWADLPHLAKTAGAFGLGVASLYFTVDLSAPLDDAETRRVLDAIGDAAGIPVEITLHYSDDRIARSNPEGDATATAFLAVALERAEAAGSEVRLYPHFAFWMERVDDALRLIASLDSARLGITFPAFHVYALEGKGFMAALERALPRLRGANTNGSRRLAGQYFPVTIEPVGEGDFDNFAFLGALRAANYDGILGIQAYGIGGDPYVGFQRSIAAVRDIEQRLDVHPTWAKLRSDTL